MRALRALSPNRSCCCRPGTSLLSAAVRPPRRPRVAAAAMHSKEDAARLARAKSYPYARPSSSFVYINGHAFVFDCAAWPAVARGGRWLTDLPVRVPESLRRSSAGGGDGDNDEQLSVVDACDRLFGFCARQALELPPHSSSSSPAAADGHFTPILAVGSNAGVEQLGRKFPPELFPGGGVVVPVVRAVLDDFDVAYAPLITSYGSAPATLHPSPGTRVELFVTHLSPRQARRMHETEGAYNLQRLTRVRLREGVGIERAAEAAAEARLLPEPTANQLLTYGHQAGTLQLRFRRRRGGSDGAQDDEKGHVETPVALAEIRAHGRVFPALTQTQMLRAVRHALQSEEDESESEGEGGRGNTGSSSGSSGTSSGSEETDALPPPKPLPPILAPESARDCWMAADEAELDAFLLRCLDCADTRKRRVERLTAAAVPFERALVPPLSAEVEVLQTMGTVLSDNVK